MLFLLSIFSEKCFYGWRSEYIIGKLCRKRDLRICAEYFGVWKCQILGGTKAEKLVNFMYCCVHIFAEA